MNLLERTGELEALAAVIDDVAAGSGRIVLIEGPPGIGKTALVGAAQALAAERGLDVLAARGGELETDFAFGVVRQLFERRIAAVEQDEFEALFAGAASLAAGLFSFEAAAKQDTAPPEDRFSLMHGLYWLTVGLAAGKPLGLVVDDAHWADEPSLQWLGYLARRIEELPVLIVLASRSTEPEAPVAQVEVVRGDPGVVELRPSPLSPDAVGAVLSEVFAEQPRPAFTKACHGASGGNPFLLTKLAQALAADGVPPDDAGSAQVAATNPAAIASLMLARLGHLPESAQEMAFATAVLGDGAPLRNVAALAALDEGESIEAVAALTAAGFLAPGLPLRFQHPLIRSAIYADIADGDRARRHEAAARLLLDRSAPAERIAAHLLLSEPAREEWIVDTLLSAAAPAMERGAPQPAILYLRRALAEGLPERRPQLLLVLGSAETQAIDPAGVDHLREALALARGPDERSRALRMLALLLVRLGRVRDAVVTLMGELAEMPEHAGDVRLELEAELAAILHWGLDEAVDLLDATLGRAPVELTGATPAERSLLASRAYRAAKAGNEADLAAGEALRALETGLLDDQGPVAPVWASAIYALVTTDHPSARRWVETGMQRALTTGTRFGASLHSNALSIIALRHGEVADAEAFGRESLLVARDLPESIGLPSCLASLINALIERGKTETAWAELSADGFDSKLPEGALSSMLCESRGRLLVAMHRVDDGLADLLDAGERYGRWGVTRPTITRWRASAAEAYVLLGRQDEARRLAEEDLEAARGFGRPRPIGIALRALGLALGGQAAIERLQEAVAVLEPSPAARLEHARALCDLGAALRRANRRREAREVLSLGLDAASRYGAVAIANRAAEELRATGARPRRVMLSGVESLTASELRVARLAADGLTNREIAQTLFVTDKTVEKHLGNAYGKLEIKSRDELPAALA